MGNKNHDCNTGLQTTQQGDFVQGMRREEESKSLMRRNRVQHIAYSLKPTAHCCHNYYIGLLEALWDIAVNMKLSEMYLKILSIFLRKGWTHNKRKGCENTGSIGVGVSFVQAQSASSSRRALAPKGIFHHFQFSFQVRGQVCG